MLLLSLPSFLLVIIGYNKSIIVLQQGMIVLMYYIPLTRSSNVDIGIHCYRTTGTYPCIVLLLDYCTRY
jgi:hypothetical protein